jgi:hypothetical protein
MRPSPVVARQLTRRCAVLRPNFESVTIDDTDVTVSGKSDPDEFKDVLSIRVVLVQGDARGGGNVDLHSEKAPLDPDWSVEFSAGDLKEGPAVAFGVETHQANFLTFTWGQSVTIKK